MMFAFTNRSLHNIHRYLIRLLFFALALSISSCHHGNHTKKLKIGFSQCIGGDSWRKTMLSEMKRELSFHNNIKFIYKDAEGSSQKQIQQVEELLNEKIDLLIISPNEIGALASVVEKVYNQGIPVVEIDRRTNSQKFTAFIGASNIEVGQNAGKYAAALLGGQGTIIEITGLPADASYIIDRHNGFMKAISQYPGMHYLKSISNNEINGSNSELELILKTNKNVNLIYAQNDYMAFDAYKVCSKLGLEKRIKIIGIDGLPIKDAGLDMVANKYISATLLYPTGGGEAILTAINILEKKPFKKENQLFTTVIDSTNVRIMKLQNEKILAQQNDIDKRQTRIEQQIAISENQSNIIVAISITLALALIFGGILFYYLQENKKIYKKLELQKEEIADQRNQLVDLVQKVKEANEARFNFFTNISHELRTPLTLIMGPLEDILTTPKLHFTVKYNLEFIRKNTFRLLRLINQLMDFRKIEEGKMRLRASENDIVAFVNDIANSFNELAHKKNISFNVTRKISEQKLWFDLTMLDKVLFNILSNAFKFTPENGVIQVTVNKTTDDGSVVIKVEDSGIGMTKEDAEHAFDVFYQGHSSTFKGTGLGLSLSKELITLHHGQILIDSEKGRGTVFEIILPTGKNHLRPDELLTTESLSFNASDEVKIYTTDIEPIIEQPNSSDIVQKESSILLIEDNEHLRHFLKNRLNSKYDMYESDNGEQGISIAFDVVPDLIISDIILPGQNGLQITEKLKQDIRTSHIPIILLTAKSSIEEQIEGIRSQADAFITKPFNLEHLEATIRNLLKNREVLREHFTTELPNETRSNSSNKIDRKFINELSAIVENNISNEEFSIDQLCKEIGISRVQLYRKVKALLGYNVNDYILMIRMQKAKFLLSQENLSIAEVAFKVGFASQAYFSTVFKSKFGVSPSEFKAGKPGKNIK